MSLITRSDCLKQPDTHFVISGYTQPITGKALGYCLCPIGKEFDYDGTKSCVVASVEPDVRAQWPVPITNFETDASCKNGYDKVILNGQSVCVSSTCPNGSKPINMNGVSTCVDTLDSSSVVYGYLLTDPCNRITAPVIPAQSTIMDDEQKQTFFADRCPIDRRPKPIPDELLNPYQIKSPYDNTAVEVQKIDEQTPAINQTKPVINTKVQDSRQKILVSTIGICILILLWIATIYMWLTK